MLCIDNKHLYRSAFLIPRWLCRAMDFINGSLHSVSHTERCSHYSNARELHPLWNICTMESNMHEVRAALISAKNIHVNELDRTLLAELSLSLSLSLQQHRGLQLSEVGDLWSFNTGKITTFGSNVSFHRRESHTHVNRLHESGDRNAGNAIRFPATTIKNTSSCRSLKKGRNILSARSAPKRWRGLIRAETRPPSKFSGNPVQ